MGFFEAGAGVIMKLRFYLAGSVLCGETEFHTEQKREYRRLLSLAYMSDIELAMVLGQKRAYMNSRKRKGRKNADKGHRKSRSLG